MPTITGKITHTQRAESSVPAGNPRFLVTITDVDGRGFLHLTAPNSNLAYGIENHEYRDYWHEFTIDGRGNITHATVV